MDTGNNHMDPVGLLPKYFAGEATPEEQSVIDAWLKADENSRSEFDAFRRLWELTGKAQPGDEINLDDEWRLLESEIAPVRVRKIHMIRIFRIAASVVLVTALGFAGFRYAGMKSERAPYAGIAAVNMTDGTIITLNAGSRITWRKGYGLTHRNLSLRGEAYFEVAGNKALPFVITAGNTRIRVTGTKFNVRAYKDQPGVKVTVTEGSVKLYETGSTAGETILSAGETGTFDQRLKVVSKQSVLDVNDIAWKTRIMDFQGASLSEVARVLENTYHLKVWVDPAVQQCPITVRFENRELEPVLDVLKSTLDLSITGNDNQITIKGDGCGMP